MVITCKQIVFEVDRVVHGHFWAVGKGYHSMALPTLSSSTPSFHIIVLAILIITKLRLSPHLLNLLQGYVLLAMHWVILILAHSFLQLSGITII